MTKDWLEHLESHRPSRIEQVVRDVDNAVHDFFQHVRLSNWRPISAAPYNQEFELRIKENREIVTLEFPCLRTNEEAWINVDLGTEIRIEPVEWRHWQRERSPEPHRSKIRLSDRSALFHHDLPHTLSPKSDQVF
jgi:hypothetical protein